MSDGRAARTVVTKRKTRRAAVLVVAASCVAAVCGYVSPAVADDAAPDVVSVVPAATTPNVNDGIVYAIGEAGGKIILGGTFTSASPADDPNTVDAQANAMAFDPATGDIDSTGFLPVVDGRVNTVIPGPKPNEVYIAGAFNTVDGVAMHVALLDTRTGAIVPTWHPASLNGGINKLVLSHRRLFVAGGFDLANGGVHDGLVALKPNTGTLTSYVGLDFTQHHNYERKCDPDIATCAKGDTGVRSIAVNPSGSELVALGNFVDVSGTKRDQIAVLDLGPTSATLDQNWNTKSYTAACFSNADDSYVRDVKFSPDGSYFVVTATGGIGTNSDGTKGQCDSVARYDTADSGANVKATWVDYTGEDTLWTAAVTDTAIYVGGHERWLNNYFGENMAAAGAVPRPGIGAVSPTSGLPLAWNPGRNPRGAGAFALLVTGDGLYVGSDTDYIGDGQYLRKKLAFFPLAGGTTLPLNATPKLPGRVFLAGANSDDAADPDRFVAREFNGSELGSVVTDSTDVDWGSVRGVFSVNGDVYYGGMDGMLHSRTFDGSSFGPDVVLDPYDDPTWDSVQTGSGQTYNGVQPTFNTEIPSLSSLFFHSDRIYYTVVGDALMHWRWFEPESGVVGAEEFTLPAGQDWTDIAGAFLAKKTLFFASASTGDLMSLSWDKGHAVGTPTVVDTSIDWASRGLFVLSSATNPTQTPTASATASCTKARCSFTAAEFVDADGGITKYGWAFGDGSHRGRSVDRTVTHHFRSYGTHHVTLTVTTTSGMSSSSVVTVHLKKESNAAN